MKRLAAQPLQRRVAIRRRLDLVAINLQNLPEVVAVELHIIDRQNASGHRALPSFEESLPKLIAFPCSRVLDNPRVSFDRETGIDGDFRPAAEPAGRRARPGCRVRDRAQAAARGPVPAAWDLPGVPALVRLLAGAKRGPVPADGEPDRGLRSAEPERPGGVEQVAATGRPSDRAGPPRTAVPGAFAGLQPQRLAACLPARS